MITMNVGVWRITFRQAKGKDVNNHRIQIVDIVNIANDRQHILMSDSGFLKIKDDLTGEEFISIKDWL